MKNLTVWSDSLVPIRVVQGDPTSESVTIYLIDSDGNEITHEADFEEVDGEMIADLSFTAPSVNELEIYDYYLTENFNLESPLIYPDPNNCSEGECELPTISVCPLPGETS